jgi:hypothetical protein
MKSGMETFFYSAFVGLKVDSYKFGDSAILGCVWKINTVRNRTQEK